MTIPLKVFPNSIFAAYRNITNAGCPYKVRGRAEKMM
jgi:hypothetical protein